MSFTETVEIVGKGVDAAGVILMIGGILLATTIAVARRADGADERLHRYRRGVGAAILLGLEVLVAADIIARSPSRHRSRAPGSSRSSWPSGRS